MFTAALIGFLLGFITSVPIAGPISILVFGRGLQNRAQSGIYIAIGAALAEGGYAFLAFWGFSELLLAYPWVKPLSGGLAAVILLALGWRFARLQPEEPEAVQLEHPSSGRKRSFLLGLTIAGLNPTLLATWPAMVSFAHALGVLDVDSLHALPFSIGVAAGISGWFALLLSLLARFRGRFGRQSLNAIVRVIGVVLVVLGIAAAVRFVFFVIELSS